MKKTNCALTATIALGGLIAFTSAAPAQEKKPEIKPVPPSAPTAPAVPGAPPSARPRPDRSEQIGKFLELSDEQKTKAKPILDEETKQFTAMRDMKELAPTDRSAKYKEIREATNAKMKPILTAQQWEKWDKMRGITPRPAPTAPPVPTAPTAPPPAPGK